MRGGSAALCSGFVLAVAYQFQTAGLKLTTPSKSAFITGMTLVLVPVLGALPGVRRSGSRPPAWNVWLGVVLAFSGVVLLAAPPGNLTGIGVGDLLTLGCAFAFAGHIIFQDRVSDKGAGKETDLAAIPFEQLALLQVGFCTLVMAASTPLLEKPYLHWTRLLVVTLVIEAVFATAAAFTIQSWAQKFLAPTYLVLIYAMEPVFAWLTSLAVLHQGLSARAGWGAILILSRGVGGGVPGQPVLVTDSASNRVYIIVAAAPLAATRRRFIRRAFGYTSESTQWCHPVRAASPCMLPNRRG